MSLTHHRIKFEEEQLRATQGRLADLDGVIRGEDEALVRHEQTKQQIEAEIQDAEASVQGLKAALANANADLENHTTNVDQAKRAYNKAAKAVDQVLKDIATKACEIPVGVFNGNAHSSSRTVKSRSSVWSVRPSTGVAG